MKLIHLSDLHLGKRLHEFPFLEDQAYILDNILEIIIDEMPDAALIAGDVYDKSSPSAEAVSLFDDFLVSLAATGTKVFVIGGNHDSPERLSFGGRLMAPSGVFLAPAYSGIARAVALEDGFGSVNIFMLPFVKTANVRAAFPEDSAGFASHTDAIRRAVAEMGIDPGARNVLVAHQFITDAVTCDSEEASLGGSDNVDASVFDGFDYVALGHLHGPQYIEKESIRYCGSPLKYSFSECEHEKSLTVVELGRKGDVRIDTRPLSPRRDMREIKGAYDELMNRANYINTDTDDYLHITLTDEETIPYAINRLRIVYPNVMRLDYENTRTKRQGGMDGDYCIKNITPLEALAELFERQSGKAMSAQQEKYAAGLVGEIWGDEK